MRNKSPDKGNPLLLSEGMRYRHTLAAARSEGRLYSVKNRDGLLIMEDERGRDCLPLWPAARFAQLMLTEEWKGFEIVELSLRELMEMGARLSEAGIELALFPTLERPGEVVTPERLRRDLESLTQ